MAINDVSLTAGMKANLVNLQSTVNLINRTQTRLSSGKKVNNALDDPTNYFTARDHLNRATDLASRKDGMGEAIQTFKTANSGIDGITKLLEAAKGLATSARSANSAGRATMAAQFDTLLAQIDRLADDSTYKGINLLASDNLIIDFNEDGSNQLTVSGFDATSGGLGINAVSSSLTTVATAVVEGFWGTANYVVRLPDGTVTSTVGDDMNAHPENYRIVDSATGGAGAIATGNDGNFGFTSFQGNYWAVIVSGSFNIGDAVTVQYSADGFNQTTGLPNTGSGGTAWDTTGGIDTSLTEIQNAMNSLRSQSAGLASKLGIVTTRQEFTTSMINALQTGSDNLTLADMNQEGANMLMLQTRQSLGTTALGLAAQGAQSVLRLF